ncbi:MULTISPECIES: hypothetical protein [unclassified Anabaena]|uniref:hypothetical protein n=1 Tax=unclassified Anabaena TaxID=2619674 RepID=UPI002B1EBA04|nr:hypothetical protein [Anabaena sp. UHCC 0399]MEA5564979.1 hypothetical protein [Anabaena sp. UHCC 0399]
MANITISDLQPVELEYAELSDLELEIIMGGKGEVSVSGGYSEDKGAYVEAKVTFKF